MANDSRIVITAGLQIPETVHNIQKELNEQVAPKLNLKIACNISDSNLSQLQSQLSKISEKLTLNVNTGNIQQSISQAAKAEPVKINVTAELNKSALQKQAKEIEQSLGIQYFRGQTEALRGELKALLADYQKAISTNSLADMESTMTKIAEHAATYRQEVTLTNEELKLQQDRAKEILREQHQLYITAEQYSALQRQAAQDGRTATQLLNSSLGVGKWSTDISKFDSRNIPYWSKYAEEINQINPLKDAVVNEGDIVQGLIDLNELLSKTTDLTSQQLKRNGQEWQNWVDTVLNAVNMARGEGSIFSDSFIDLASDAGVSRVEDNAQKLAQAYSTVQAAKDLYQNDKSVKSVTADWTFDANKNVTGFTINVNKLNGEVERLKHSISETGDVEFLGGNASDRGVQKQTETIIKFVNDYTAKLNSLKATVGQDFAPNISATVGKDMEKTTVTFDSFEKKLAELLKGNGSMGQLRSEFTALDGAVKNLGANLRGSDTSLNQFTNAINNSRKFDNTLKALEVDYQNLNEKQRESKDLTSSLADAQKKVADLQNTQKTEGYTNKWVSQYREANIALTQLTADLKLAKKLEQQDTSSAARKQADALKEVRDIYKEITRLTNKINMPSVTGENKAELERQLAVKNDTLNKTILIAQQEGIINDEFRQQIQYYETIQQNNLLDIQSRQRELAATQAQVDAQKRIVENAKQTADALNKISAAYDKILQLNKKLLSGKLNEAEYRDTQKKIEQLEISAIKERQNLEAAGLYTEEIQKQISAIRNRQETLTEAKKEQLASAEAQRSEDEKVAKALETYNKGLKTVQDAYKEIARLSKEVLSPNATDIRKSFDLADIAMQRELIAITQERLAAEGLIDKAFEQEIRNGELLVQREQQITKSEIASAQAKKDEADAERQYKQELQDVNRLINDNLAALEKFNNSTVAKNNASNPTVASQTGLNADLINQLRGLQESLANDKSPENVARIIARLNELGGSLKDAAARSVELNQSLKDNDASAKFSAKLNQLKNQVDIFASTNRRATESLRLMRDGQTTFAQGWQNIRDALSNGNLDSASLQRLTEQFRNFRGEADAAGLTVSRFFQSMQSQLRMVLQRWISLYAVIGYIRKMIDNVKELDAAMINLRRVTDETDAGYQRFLEDANELARQMKTTTSSLIEMSYQWSKLGYSINDALELAKSSTIFMRVADVGQDQALSNLVTALKAFRIEAGQTMDVVDKLDKLNNEYAVSAAGLGDGLERTASAMAMTGNSLDETLALLTGAGEITQNLENTGKILPMRNYIG